MKARKLGWTALSLSTIVLGTWAMGGGGWKFSWGPQGDRESIATIWRALQKGVNWIDTAPVYGLGHAEEVVDVAIKEGRDKPIIATKCSQVWDKDRNIFGRLKRESISSEVEASLKRLNIDVIDLYQIHRSNNKLNKRADYRLGSFSDSTGIFSSFDIMPERSNLW